ncbi:MAG: 2'-5' RNA ligase family protein [Bacteroidales bacterium]|nr:2'-5' RNA ligase family protein [Bacteroidales bacterium]
MKGIPENKSGLYFIAIVFHGSLSDEIRVVKERMRDQYGAAHALKSPAHITLQMPFKRILSVERGMCDALTGFALKEKPFTVELNGYGAFVPRVIFIKIVEPGPVKSLHGRLRDVLLTELGFGHDEIMNDMQPHITVATRDLARDAFSDAWQEMKDEEFVSSFEVRSIFLLRHNGRSWDLHEEFPFGIQ